MNAKDAIRNALTSTQRLLNWYLSDLSDADLLVRPVPAANHIAWQLGHLITSEVRMGRVVPGAKYPELPAGFAERHAKETAAVEPPKGFGTKAEYLDLFNKARAATLAAADQIPEADLDRPTEGPVAQFAPTVGALLLLTGNHTMMHAGQFSVVRRKLGKPILF
jgi:hypothetical protein